MARPLKLGDLGFEVFSKLESGSRLLCRDLEVRNHHAFQAEYPIVMGGQSHDLRMEMQDAKEWMDEAVLAHLQSK